MQARAREFESQPDLVRRVIAEGCEAAGAVARDTMGEVREVMSLRYE